MDNMSYVLVMHVTRYNILYLQLKTRAPLRDFRHYIVQIEFLDFT